MKRFHIVVTAAAAILVSCTQSRRLQVIILISLKSERRIFVLIYGTGHRWIEWTDNNSHRIYFLTSVDKCISFLYQRFIWIYYVLNVVSRNVRWLIINYGNIPFIRLVWPTKIKNSWNLQGKCKRRKMKFLNKKVDGIQIG